MQYLLGVLLPDVCIQCFTCWWLVGNVVRFVKSFSAVQQVSA